MPEAIPPLGSGTPEHSNVITQETLEDYSKFERLPEPEEVEMLRLANNIALAEIVRLGIDSKKVRRIIPFPVPLERVKVLLPGHPKVEHGIAHVDLTSGYLGIGSAEVLEEFIGPVDGDVKKLRLFRSMLHEVIHVAGISEYTNHRARLRAGYGILNLTPGTDHHEHLRGFNEGVVESLAQLWFFMRRNEISKNLHVPVEVFDNELLKASGYDTEMRVLDEIIKRIAAAKHERPSAVGERIARGHFTGEIMHLRDVDAALGRGSLRILAGIRSTPLYESTEAKIKQRSADIADALLSTQSDFARDRAASDTLSGEEYFAYMRDKYSKSIDEAIILASGLAGPLTADDQNANIIADAFHRATKMFNAIAPRESVGYDGRPLKKIPRYAQSYLDNSARLIGRKRELLRRECERLGLFEQNLA